MSAEANIVADLNERSREVFRLIVENYLESGEPVGSRTLTRSLSKKVSAATVRNVMQDLEFLGLLDSPHISAGRVPTERGLRLFVDGLLELGDVSREDREKINGVVDAPGQGVAALLDRVGAALSVLTQSASLVLVPKRKAPVRQVEFVSLSPGRALAVLVFTDGHVENRMFTPPEGQTGASMREAANFVNAVAEGRTISEMHDVLEREVKARRQEIDTLARAMVESGLAMWENQGQPSERLIVRGRSNLLGSAAVEKDLDRVRELFDDLERKRDIARYLEGAEEGEGVRIFIGSENKLFSLTGSSLVVSSYMNADRKIVGAVGVIGPTRLNYGRIVPIVDYTAQLIGKLISDRR